MTKIEIDVSRVLSNMLKADEEKIDVLEKRVREQERIIEKMREAFAALRELRQKVVETANMLDDYFGD